MDMQNKPASQPVRGPFKWLAHYRIHAMHDNFDQYKDWRLRNRIIIYILVELLHTPLPDYLLHGCFFLGFFLSSKYINVKIYDDFIV